MAQRPSERRTEQRVDVHLNGTLTVEGACAALYPTPATFATCTVESCTRKVPCSSHLVLGANHQRVQTRRRRDDRAGCGLRLALMPDCARNMSAASGWVSPSLRRCVLEPIAVSLLAISSYRVFPVSQSTRYAACASVSDRESRTRRECTTPRHRRRVPTKVHAA